jgi:hypothetical protein
MSSTGWRNLCLVLGAVCIVQLWRGCDRPDAEPARAADCPSPTASSRPPGATMSSERTATTAGVPPSSIERAPRDGLTAYGFTIPSWAIWFAPHPGEDLRAYRKRMLPLAQAAIAPQRARVARGRDSFAALANLDPRQRTELDAAARDTASALQDRVMSAVLGGELAPASFKPMAGVSIARELLDIIGRGERRFTDTLRDDQRAALAQHPFDFGDYLLFSTPWEDALSFLD